MKINAVKRFKKMNKIYLKKSNKMWNENVTIYIEMMTKFKWKTIK